MPQCDRKVYTRLRSVKYNRPRALSQGAFEPSIHMSALIGDFVQMVDHIEPDVEPALQLIPSLTLVGNCVFRGLVWPRMCMTGQVHNVITSEVGCLFGC